jgi:hypothetical protein
VSTYCNTHGWMHQLEPCPSCASVKTHKLANNELTALRQENEQLKKERDEAKLTYKGLMHVHFEHINNLNRSELHRAALVEALNDLQQTLIGEAAIGGLKKWDYNPGLFGNFLDRFIEAALASQPPNSVLETLEEVERYLCWHADDLSGDDMAGDQRHTKRYKDILTSLRKLLGQEGK